MKKIIGLIVIAAFGAYYYTTQQSIAQDKIPNWPPQEGVVYPDLSLIDSDGNSVSLASFKGKILIIKPIGMSCPACNAWSGAKEKGGFKGTKPQQNLESLEEYARQRGINMNNENILVINLLLFNMALKPTVQQDAKAWEEHFDHNKKPNYITLAGSEEMLNKVNYKASYKMIPGFHLVDQNFILRSDATGHHPKRDPYTHLIPMISRLLKRS